MRILTSMGNKPSNISNTRPTPIPVAPASAGDGIGGYTKEEIQVLKLASLINGREYLPFIAADERERFAFPVPFSDECGLLKLSDKQKQNLKGWMRPSEFAEDPQMIMAMSSFCIKQNVVSDCSFIASLAISVAYERRFRKKLITSIIYPQNEKGEPVYNPCGKYMVKLHLNGVPRKVIIDDLLPVDKYCKLLCSHSSNRNELWVSLIEKAYMKVMGGYDFPGSNSNIDLHALTGWIPERQSLREENFIKEYFFDKVFDRFHKGHCLATISTGPMTKEEQNSTGLVATFAYAVLDIRKVDNLRMLQLKNPWGHHRWKGKFGAQDDERWTPKLQQALNYDSKLAQQYDNGVFWIEYDSALQFYDTFYVSWDPEIFTRRTCCHFSWMAKDGPERDAYSLRNNPQFSLEVRNQKVQCVVYVVLTRHITDKDDFAQNKEFITMLVYKNEGKKVYYPHSPSPFIDGVRINSPHYLTKLQVPAMTTGPNRYTLVVSQYEKHKNTQYTIQAYATADFSLNKIVSPYKFYRRLHEMWTESNAGGCANHKDTYHKNPVYQVNLKSQAAGVLQLLIELRGPKTFSVGFDVTCVEAADDKPFQQEMSGDFKSGYSMLEMNVPPGVYNIIPCTFAAKKIGPFFLDISSSLESTIITKVK